MGHKMGSQIIGLYFMVQICCFRISVEIKKFPCVHIKLVQIGSSCNYFREHIIIDVVRPGTMLNFLTLFTTCTIFSV